MSVIVYFLRHGLAEEWETWSQDDSLRPLTSKGKRVMQQEAETLVRWGVKIDLIITSPLTRAHETAEIVSEAFGQQVNLVQDKRLEPGFGLSELQSLLQDYPQAANIMVVGHEPDFSQTVADLIGGGTLLFKKGGLARVDLVGTSPISGELVWLIPPKMLASGTG